MTILLARVARTRWIRNNGHFLSRMVAANPVPTPTSPPGHYNPLELFRAVFSTTCYCFQKAEKEKTPDDDPRINLLGRAIEDDFATIRAKYGLSPSPPSIVLC